MPGQKERKGTRDKADRELLDQIRHLQEVRKGATVVPKVFSILKSRGFAEQEKRGPLMKEHGMVARVETVYRKLNTVREVLRISAESPAESIE